MTDILKPGFSDVPLLSDIIAFSSSSTIPPPDISAYLTHLTSLPLSALESEPTELSSSSAQLTNALTTLCYTSYPTFLSLHSTTSTLSSSLSSFSSSLDALISSLPALEGSARTFAQDTREIQKERRKAALVLEHHDKLHDVLSLPVLLDSCIRNHNYTEALLLADHATALSQRFPSNSLIQSVKSECDARVQAMLGQLLHMLSEQAKLPALFRAVGFLRKMEVLEEEELALAFLTGRGACIEGVLKTLEIERKGLGGDRDKEKEAYARYLKRYVDLWREGVHDVITQYTTIFLDRAPSTSLSTPTRLHTLLTTFTTLHLQTLLSLLRDTLPLIPDPSLLTSLLTQLTYCANSFARVGMDFKSLLAPIFVDAVKKGITKELQDAAESWCSKLRQGTGTREDKPRSHSTSSSVTRPSKFLVSPSSFVSPPLPTANQLEALASGPANVPPPILVSYPPLATYTNAVLTALNSLRMFAPIELLGDLLHALEEALTKGLTALLILAQQRPWTAGADSKVEEKKDSEVLRAVGTVYSQVFIPFLRRGLVEGVYGVPMREAKIAIAKDLADVMREWQTWIDGSQRNGLNGE
ncbi:hypothetical protein AcV5_005263 [Taiwanofungus camphoratus]|nr:hypothetical protein AcW2_000131 [Antrodia cinnamomea]KAI0937329.1 hypothetical protein AcV5_005263 [Antrodia cinnamomea]KAI0962543.1 hypothetical protein AcV7_001365 [Antrodia cinnamomea]